METDGLKMPSRRCQGIYPRRFSVTLFLAPTLRLPHNLIGLTKFPEKSSALPSNSPRRSPTTSVKYEASLQDVFRDQRPMLWPQEDRYVMLNPYRLHEMTMTLTILQPRRLLSARYGQRHGRRIGDSNITTAERQRPHQSQRQTSLCHSARHPTR